MSGTCGSSGGGITLPEGFRGPNGEPWLSANIASAPFTGHPAVGLHLFTSTDPSLHNYTRYQPQGAGSDPCVICPALVPSEVHAGYIGDNYAFSDPPADVVSDDRTYYVLAGTLRCKNHSNQWCGIPPPGTPAAMLFSSSNLVDWKYESLFTDSIRDGGWNYTKKTRVDCPDTYTLPDGRQVLLWLDDPGTRWNIGTLNNRTKQFSAQYTGLEGHGTGVTQSLWDAQKRRVQIGWIQTPFSAAQTLPHLINLSASGDSFEWLPLPEMTTLHGEHRDFYGLLRPQPGASNRSSVLALVNRSDAFGLHMHVQATFTFPASSCEAVSLGIQKSTAAFFIDVHCGAAMANLGVLCSGSGRRPLATGDPRTDSTTSIPIPMPRVSTGPSLVVDVYVDSVIVEVFSGGAHVAHTHSTSLEEIDGETIQGTGVDMGVAGGAVGVRIDLWQMKPSIGPACSS